MWVGWGIEGLLLSARLPPQLADLPVPPEQGKFCRALKLKPKNLRKKKKKGKKNQQTQGKKKKKST